MSNPSALPSHRRISDIRPTTTGAPASPHTPLRTISSAFGSPSALRAEEDCVILELGARYLRAGFAGDTVAKAIIDFGPEEHRRAGDYGRWEVDYNKSGRSRVQEKEWGEAYELWRPDLRGLDLGLVGDKIDRAVREAFTKYLLIDSRPRRMVLALPSALPLPLLSATLDTLFNSFQPPSISLLSAPVLTTVAAGLRSALVVDIGWAETVVTSVYEYREVQCCRSIRATKFLGEATFKMLAEAMGLALLLEDSKKITEEEARVLPSLEECEEVLQRMVWCKPAAKSPQQIELSQGLAPVREEDEFRSSMRSLNIGEDGEPDREVSLPLTSTNPPQTLLLPFSKLAEPCENAIFAAGRLPQDMDDEELPLHLLVYRSLLQLPMDVRSICMSRIIFVGGGSNLPGLKGRVLDELANILEQRGWDPVQGKAVEQLCNNPKLQRTKYRPPGPIEVPQVNELHPASAALQDQEPDPIEEQLKREARKGTKPTEHGTLRAIESLGAFAGGSLLSQLKIPTVSTIDRDQWLQHGASGASRSGEISVGHQRQSMGPGAINRAGDRTSWTLGLWG